MTNRNIALIAFGGFMLVAATAMGTVYVTERQEQPQQQSQQQEPSKETASAQTEAPVHHTRIAQHRCDDQNIAGKVVGGIGGGVLGSLMGKGSGKTAMTIGGVLAGAYAGGQAIPMQNATCPH